MRNPVLERWAVIAAVSVGFGVAGCTTTQEITAKTAVIPNGVEQNIGPLVLRAHSDIASFEITAARGPVVARLIREDIAEVSGDTCPALQRVIDDYRTLPALRPGPILLLPEGWLSQSRGPTRKDATWWTITVLAYAPDDTAVQVNLSGDQGPYAVWADEALAAIRACIPAS